MNKTMHQVLLWGWLRFLLAVLQISLAGAGAGALLTCGLCPLTWGFVLSATAATLLSRLLYRGQPFPQQ